MDFIYEKEDDILDGRAKFIHKFIECLPNTPEFTENNLSYLVNHDDDDLENFGSIDRRICYICDQSKHDHKEKTNQYDSSENV